MKKFLFLILAINFSCANDDINECVSPGIWGPIDECPQNLNPVCGCNTVTYDNECLARVAGVVTWTKGKCP